MMSCLRLMLVAVLLIAACGDSSGPGDVDASTSDATDQADATLIDANPSAPVCTITAPADNTSQPFSSEWTFVADASDLEDGPLSGASIQWVSDQLGVIGTGNTLTLVLDPPYAHQITCVATDSSLLTGSDTITVNAFSPAVSIFHPGDGETRPQCPSTIPFVAEALDYEDGNISDSVVWTSDLDGQFGTGASFDGQLCGTGLNTVTATATDSDVNTATDTITLTITP